MKKRTYGISKPLSIFRVAPIKVCRGCLSLHFRVLLNSLMDFALAYVFDHETSRFVR